MKPTNEQKYTEHKWERDKKFNNMKICNRCQLVRQPQTPKHIGDSVYYRAEGKTGLFDCRNIGDDPGCPTDLNALNEYKVKRNAEMEELRSKPRLPGAYIIMDASEPFLFIGGE